MLLYLKNVSLVKNILVLSLVCQNEVTVAMIVPMTEYFLT